MKNVVAVLLLAFVGLFFTGCEDDFMDKFPPEVLYKHLVKNADGKSDWVVSPNAKMVELDAGETSWTVRARVSAPNVLQKIVLKLVAENGSETTIIEITDLETTPNEYQLEYPLQDITKDTEVSIEATDKRGLFTKRNFKIIKK